MVSSICAIGDTHGHLQLALCMAASWQDEQQTTFEAVFLCGDVGTFTSEDQLDDATRRHAEKNPCELEFLYQWSVDPFPRWLRMIFAPKQEGGLGLTCPVVMVHGNHEGFSHIETLIPTVPPKDILDIDQLPTVDSGGFIRYLPSGFRCRTASGKTVGGIGGIEFGHREGRYHNLAYFDERTVSRFLEYPMLDLLITHQGPSSLQGDGGSLVLQSLLDAARMKVWCHGHSVSNPKIVTSESGVRVVPLEDATFQKQGSRARETSQRAGTFVNPTGEPNDDCMAMIQFPDDSDVPAQITRGRPANWHIFRRQHWYALDDKHFIALPLNPFIDEE
jgi:predicted phosphodiesterase